jgi:hypothetical protein
MAGIPKDSEPDRPDGDKSLQLLLITFIATGSMAGLMIVIAYATAGDHLLDEAEPMRRSAAGSEPGDKVELSDAQPGEPVYDFTEYIDKLLASAENESSK